MKRRYTGGCHCGVVRFEADVDLAAGTFKCNCTMCWKTRMWGAIETRSFRLLSGEGALVDYQPFRVHRPFCGTCGVPSFGWFEDDEGGRVHVARVACLEDVDVEELLAAPVVYLDGLHDDFENPPDEIRHL